MLNRHVDAAGLVFFRVAFGGILFVELARYLTNQWVVETYVAPRFHFTYYGFAWVTPWPEPAMTAHFVVLGLLAALIAAGAYYRLATVLFFLGFTYVFLLEKAVYLNHLFLICLVSFLLILLPLHGAWSWDARRGRRSGQAGENQLPDRPPGQMPAWALWVLRAQIAIPYVFGALAKLNGDWLSGQPMQLWMSRMEGVVTWIPGFGEPWLAMLVSWAGFLFDLLVVPLLFWKPSRPFAFAAAVLFHLANALLWEIGVFPWFMICATTLFLDPAWPRRLLNWPVVGPSLARAFKSHIAEAHASRGRDHQRASSATVVDSSRANSAAAAVAGRYLLVGTLTLFFAVQLLAPFRHLFYPGHVDWTEEGSQFAWRMMLNDKAAVLQLSLVDPASRRRVPLDPRRFLTRRQIDKMSHDPEMLREFAVFVKGQLQDTDFEHAEVRALVLCALNGRKPQLLVDPTIDLGAETRTLGHKAWIIPLREPLPKTPWLVPQDKWIEHVDLRPPEN